MTKKKIIPGWRYFHCKECDHYWRDKCRDATSSSAEFCDHCGEDCEPFKSTPHPEWPVDKHGNLIEDSIE